MTGLQLCQGGGDVVEIDRVLDQLGAYAGVGGRIKLQIT